MDITKITDPRPVTTVECEKPICAEGFRQLNEGLTRSELVTRETQESLREIRFSVASMNILAEKLVVDMDEVQKNITELLIFGSTVKMGVRMIILAGSVAGGLAMLYLTWRIK